MNCFKNEKKKRMIITDHDYYWKLYMYMFLCVNLYNHNNYRIHNCILKVAITIGNVQG